MKKALIIMVAFVSTSCVRTFVCDCTDSDLQPSQVVEYKGVKGDSESIKNLCENNDCVFRGEK